MKTIDVQCGYLPLVDSAPLIIAQELKFAAEEGLNLTLARQPSWSALRDRLAFGQIDFAHMLSPMPIAMSLGIGGVPAPIDALMVLSVNGTVIGVSNALDAQMSKAGWTNSFGNPRETADAVLGVTKSKLRVGVPFPFSMHRMLLEHWLSNDPKFDADRVDIITIPPPQMANAMRDGVLDMFCVGEPWGSVAVQQSDAVLVLPGASIWQFAPEKVLGARHGWVNENQETCLAMIRAIFKAARWLDDVTNAPLAVEILARSQHLDLPDHAIEPALLGRMSVDLNAKPISADRFLTFHQGAANFPWRSHACWIADRLARWHGLDQDTARDKARNCFRSDLYRNALTQIGADMPGASEKVEGAMMRPTAVASAKGQMILGPDVFFDGALFDVSSSGESKN